MSIVYDRFGVQVHHDDCLTVLRGLVDASVDSIVTDPPAGIAFMGRDWDRDRGGRDRWVVWLTERMVEAHRVLKPGGHALVWALPRTSHWTAWALEDAGFEIRDCITHLFGNGMPKSRDVSKDIDRMAGPGSAVVGVKTTPDGKPYTDRRPRNADQDGWDRPWKHDEAAWLAQQQLTAPATDDARLWSGWGTGLKPSGEIWHLAQKPAGHTAIIASIGSEIDRLETECASRVSAVARSSRPTHHDAHGARTGSAPGPAATRLGDDQARQAGTGRVAGSSAPTATSASGSTADMCWSTVVSWRRCWAEICELMSTFTTATTSSTTTDLTTLSSCLSQITPERITVALISSGGCPSIVEAVDSLFAACVLRLRATRTLSATETATAVAGSRDKSGDGSLLVDSAHREGPGSSSASEHWWLVRKPFRGTIAGTVLEYGTGAINIDGCRVGMRDARKLNRIGSIGYGGSEPQGMVDDGGLGRWPSNVVLSHAAVLDPVTGEVVGDACADACADGCAVAELNAQSGVLKSGGHPGGLTQRPGLRGNTIISELPSRQASEGTASRFVPTFRWATKAPSAERPRVNGTAHPTVKSLGLMRWLVRLVTPPGGLVVDMFAGTGTTGQAARAEGMRSILIEADPLSIPYIRARLDALPKTESPSEGATPSVVDGESGDLFALLDG